MDEDTKRYRWILEYAPSPRRKESFVGTRKEMEDWFGSTIICSCCADEVRAHREGGSIRYTYFTPDTGESREVEEPCKRRPDYSPWNTGCGCEWEVASKTEEANGGTTA